MDFLKWLLVSAVTAVSGLFGMDQATQVGVPTESNVAVEQRTHTDIQTTSTVPKAPSKQADTSPIPTSAYAQKVTPEAQPTTVPPTAKPLAVTGGITFDTLFEISANLGASPRGYIASSIDGKRFWVADGKLAYVVTYFGPNNTNTDELFYDGKKVNIHDGPTNYTITKDFINGVPEITDRLAFYAFNLEKFFFGDEVYPKSGVVFDARSIGGKLALVSQSGFTYGSESIETDYRKAGKIYNVGGKLASIKTSQKSGGGIEFELIWDGKKYATAPYITEVVDFQGAPAYIQYDSTTQPMKAVVMYKGHKVSKEYPRIFDLKVIGGKLAYIAQKNIANPPGPDHDSNPELYVLIWNDKEYGTKYDTVMGYIDSAGVPAYMAANYVREDGHMEKSNAQFLVRGDTVVFSGKQGEEMIWQERELADVDGNPAIIVRTPMTQSLYVYYRGKKYFEGYDINYVRNVSGKLAVLVGKDRVQYVFMEK